MVVVYSRLVKVEWLLEWHACATSPNSSAKPLQLAHAGGATQALCCSLCLGLPFPLQLLQDGLSGRRSGVSEGGVRVRS